MSAGASASGRTSKSGNRWPADGGAKPANMSAIGCLAPFVLMILGAAIGAAVGGSHGGVVGLIAGFVAGIFAGAGFFWGLWRLEQR